MSYYSATPLSGRSSLLSVVATLTVFWLSAMAVPLKKGTPTLQAFPIPIKISVPPVVFVPGIGGSIMADETGLRVWVRFYEASYYFQRYMWGRYDKENQTLVPYPGQSNIYPVLTGFGLDAIRNLDPSVHWPIYDYLAYFDAMIRLLQLEGWVPGYNLFGVPWDWRQSMCWPSTLERLKQTILYAKNTTGRNVTLITHSMGSLVVKCFISTYPELFESNVDAWIAIAAPFQGASAKIFVEFLQGYNLGNLVIGAKDAKGLSLESPSVYELLPRQEFAWDKQPQISLTLNGSRLIYGVDHNDPAAAGTYEEVLREALRRHNLTLPSGLTLPEPFNDDVWSLSQSTRARIAAARLPASVRFYNAVGVGQATPIALDFAAVGSLEELQTAKFLMAMADGDGTVARESARAHGMEAVASVEIAADHMGIMMHPDALSFILDALYDRL